MIRVVLPGAVAVSKWISLRSWPSSTETRLGAIEVSIWKTGRVRGTIGVHPELDRFAADRPEALPDRRQHVATTEEVDPAADLPAVARDLARQRALVGEETERRVAHMRLQGRAGHRGTERREEDRRDEDPAERETGHCQPARARSG